MRPCASTERIKLTRSCSGNEIGPFRAIEESILAQLTNSKARSDIYAWYNLIGNLGWTPFLLLGLPIDWSCRPSIRQYLLWMVITELSNENRMGSNPILPNNILCICWARAPQAPFNFYSKQ